MMAIGGAFLDYSVLEFEVWFELQGIMRTIEQMVMLLKIDEFCALTFCNRLPASSISPSLQKEKRR